jgi:LPXTG-site transpeptidase (sortase) family protein
LRLPRSRWGIVSLVAGLAGVAFLALSFVDRGSSSGVSVREGGRAALIAAGVAAGESPLQSTNYVSSLEELHRLYGEPPDATAGRMRIPSLKIDAPLSVRVVGSGGQMPNPSGPDDVVYYDFSAWRGYGGYPTAGGNAVFAAHVDEAAHLDYAGLDYLGPGVFFRLNDIDKGAVIELDLGNGPVKYKVRWVREVSVEDSDWKSLLGSNVSVDSITLITCGGDYSTSAHAYTHRTVVRAERA